MAKYFLLVKVFSRSNGSRVTRAAAYRAGERIRDERTSECYNYSDRKDIVHSEIILPDAVAQSSDIEWERNRSKLWNAAEKSGTRRNSRLGREVLVILPPEIGAASRTELARKFAVELSEKYRNAVDFNVHEPRAGSDERHHHAHLLMTVREVTPKGLGTRTILDLSGTERHARGLGPSKDDLLWIRSRWADLTNQALANAGISQRVDHRSYRLQGLDRDPAVALPQKVFYAERKHGKTAAGDEIRARHRERAEARQRGNEAFQQVLKEQKGEARRAASLRVQDRSLPYGALNRDELNARRRQDYQENKQALNERRRQSQRKLVHIDDDTQKSRLELRREKRRQQFQSMSEGQREQERAKAREQYRKRVVSAERRPPTAEDSVKGWLEFRKSHGPGPTAEEAIQNWLAHRNKANSSGMSAQEVEQDNPHRNRDDGTSLQGDTDMHSTVWRLTHGSSGLVLGYLSVLIPMYVGLAKQRAPAAKLFVAPLVAIPSLIVAVIVIAMAGAVLGAVGFSKSGFFVGFLGWTLTVAVGYASAFAMTSFSNPGVSHRRGSVVTSWLETGVKTTPGLSLAGVPIAQQNETKHFKFIGTTGTGKSTAIREILSAALVRGDRAVIADPDGGYLSNFYDSARGDVILNPFMAGAMKWNALAEIVHDEDVDQLARSLIPDTGETDHTWTEHARTFFIAVTRQALRAGLQDDAELNRLLTKADVEELRKLLAGTPCRTATRARK